MDCAIEIIDVRCDFPLKTGKVIAFSRPVKAKESFDDFKAAHKIPAEQCAFAVALNFDGNLTDLFFSSVQGFEAITGEPPAVCDHYKQLRRKQPAPTIAEQRNMRTVYRRLRQADPGRQFKENSMVEEMLLEASGTNSNFSRCANCNLPMFVEAKTDHRCYRCGRENLCSFCLTSHDCGG